MDIEQLYEIAAKELEVNAPRKGLFAQAFAEATGDEAKAKALYIRLRVEQLRKLLAEREAKPQRKARDAREHTETEQQAAGAQAVPARPPLAETSSAQESDPAAPARVPVPVASPKAITTTAAGAAPFRAHERAGPWRRCFARMFDITWETTLLVLVFAWWLQPSGELYMPTNLPPPWLLVGLIFALAFVLDTLVMVAVQTTPGKALHGVEVKRREGPLDLETASARNFQVWATAFAGGIPLIPIGLCLWHWHRLSERGATAYDESTQCEAWATPFSAPRIIGVLLAWVALVLGTGIASELAQRAVTRYAVWSTESSDRSLRVAPPKPSQASTLASAPQATASDPVVALHKRAEASDIAAQMELGGRYFKGDGVPRDEVTAVYWFSRAAAAGDPNGEIHLACAHAFGWAQWPVDLLEAYRLVKQSGRNASPEVKYLGVLVLEQALHDPPAALLALVASEHPRVPPGKVLELERSALLFSAASADNVQAQTLLALDLANGARGYKLDYAAAARWATLAARAQEPTAVALLGDLYEHGQGVPRNGVLAYALYSHALALGAKQDLREALDARLTDQQKSAAVRLVAAWRTGEAIPDPPGVQAAFR